jgi:nicotinamide riboside transporter PnuC
MLELLKRFWVVLTAAALVGLLCGEFWLIQKPENWPFGWMKMYLAIGPNLIADLMAILVGYAIFRFTARELYVETMKRSAKPCNSWRRTRSGRRLCFAFFFNNLRF